MNPSIGILHVRQHVCVHDVIQIQLMGTDFSKHIIGNHNHALVIHLTILLLSSSFTVMTPPIIECYID